MEGLELKMCVSMLASAGSAGSRIHMVSCYVDPLIFRYKKITFCYEVFNFLLFFRYNSTRIPLHVA